jgi:hypothetical protein
MEKSLCPYKYIFGKPNEGIHKYRIFDIAIIDVIMTIIGAFGISKFFHLNFKFVLIILFLLGIISHRLFCVKTTIDKLLFR